jgi:uncharacterized protein YeaO (DUF488 family)
MKESDISMWNTLHHDAIKVRVARPSVLSASKELLNNYKKRRITWQEFEARFGKEIRINPKTMVELKRIKGLTQEKEVYLICYEKNYPCHRFILIDLINKLQ